jgi:ammonia channel protein AmtB
MDQRESILERNGQRLISRFIGTLKHFCLMGVDGEPAVGSARLPSIVYAAYQGMFAVSYPPFKDDPC